MFNQVSTWRYLDLSESNGRLGKLGNEEIHKL